MSDLRSMYCVHCGQTLLSDDPEKCSGCGKVGGLADPRDPAVAARLAAAHRPQPPSQPSVDLLAAWRTFRTVRRIIVWGGVGVFCLVMGVYLLTNPIYWSDPRHLTFNDAAPGVAAIIVGLALLCLAFLPVFLRKRSRGTGDRPEDKTGAP